MKSRAFDKPDETSEESAEYYNAKSQLPPKHVNVY
jgi:hypothetical protein